MQSNGAGAKNYLHYIDNAAGDKEHFGRYDFPGTKENEKVYGQKTPPDYDLKAIDFPIAIFGGALDKLSDAIDVAWLREKLAKHVIFYHQYYAGHMTFTEGYDMDYFTRDVMSILDI